MDISKIQAIIEESAAKTTANVGIYFKDMESGKTAGVRSNDCFPTASVAKVFILAELFRQIENGRLSLSDRLEFTEDFRSCGSGIMRLFDVGCKLTIKDLAMCMMTCSDNTATDMLYKLVGRDSIKENVIEALDLKKTKVDLPFASLIPICFGMNTEASYSDFYRIGPTMRDHLWNTEPYLCTMEKDNVTSPEDVSKLLELIYRGQWLNELRSSQMLTIMKECQDSNRLVAKLPYGIKVAHKTGTVDRVSNDIGIVYTPKGDYIISVFFNGNTTASMEEYLASKAGCFGNPIIADLSKAIYDEYISGDNS